MATQNEEKKKKKKILPFILIPAVVLLAAAGIFLGLKGSALRKERELTPDDTERTEYQLYWNVEKDMYAYKSPAGLTSREPDKDDGLYHMLFANGGRQMTRRVKEFNVANRIDSNSVVCLEFDEDGIVSGMKTVEEAYGSYLCKEFYVDKFENNILTLNSSESLMGDSIEVDLTGIGSICYDVSAHATFAGVELKPENISRFDKFTIVQDFDGKIGAVYQTYRSVHENMYWNVDRNYDSELKCTKRVPDAEGFYSFLLAVNGEQITVKTKMRTVADMMDSFAAKSFGLRFDENGYAIDAYAPQDVTHGKSVASWYDIYELNGRDFKAVKTIAAYDTGKTFALTLAKDCEVYDVSGMGAYIGEPTTPRVSDRVQGYTNQTGEVQVLYIVNRFAQAEFYWNYARKYDSTNKTSTRKPEADGYYHIKVAHNGKLEELRTKDKSLVDEIDSVAARSFGLETNGDIITKVYQPSNVYTSKGSWYDVMKWQTADHKTFHVKKTIAATDTGTEYDIEMADYCKVYNVTETYTNNYGEETTLRIGDRIQGWLDYSGKAKIIYVVNRDATNPVTPHNAHTCADCGGNVTWQPWTKGTALPIEGGHYYLCGNVACEQQSIKANQNVVLCLNGYTIRCTGKRAYATFESGSALTIMDCKGTGKMRSSYEGDMGTTQGALIWARYGSVKLFGGTYDVSNLYLNNFGGVLDAAGGTSVEIHNATIIGGSTKKTGGAINVEAASSLLLDNVTVRGGRSDENKGDLIYADKSAVVKLTGKNVITGGRTNLYLADGAMVTLNGLASGSNIGITLATGSGVFSTNYEKNAEKYFTSDNKSYSVAENNKKLVLGTTSIKALNFDETEVTIPYPAEKQLNVTVEPKDAVASGLTWKSSDPTVATVDANGLVKSLKEGAATITATAPNGVSKSIPVTVSGEAVRVKGISLPETGGTLLLGNTMTLEPEITPSDATTKRVIWTSSNEGVASVDEDGVVTALKTGNATITAETADGGYKTSYTVTVTGHEHCVCGDGTCTADGHSHSTVQWQPWTSTNTLPMANKDNNVKYYLTEDVHLGSQQMIDADTNIFLCLNGHKVIMDSDQQRLYSTFNAGSSLTITDCGPDKHGALVSNVQVPEKTQQGNIVWVRYGTFNLYGGTLDASGVLTNGIGAAVQVPAGATFNFYNGTIIGGKVVSNPGGAVQCSGTVNMYNGVIRDGSAKYGGNVELNDDKAVFNMYGGEISNGHGITNNGGGQGGNVAVTKGTFTMNDGVIKNGTSTNWGGNVSAASATAYFTMNGGLVTGGNYATNHAGDNIAGFYQTKGSVKITGGKVDGGVYIGTGWLTLSGAPDISSGEHNVTLASGVKIACTGLKDGAKVGISMIEPGYFTNAMNPEFKKYYVSDDAKYEVGGDSTGLFLNLLIPVTGVKVEDISMTAGDYKNAVVTIEPDNAKNKNVTYAIADTNVATVDKDGKVTGVAPGETTLTVTTEDGGFTATAKVTVTALVVDVTGISLDKTTLSMNAFETATLKATVAPSNASYPEVTWTSSDETIATVDSTGKITALNEGKVTIKATSTIDTIYAECAVTITGHKHCVCLGELKEASYHSCEEVLFKDLNKEVQKIRDEQALGFTAAFKKLPSGNYYLSQDITVTSEQINVAANQNLTICLNGHTITRTGSVGRVIALFEANAKLTLTDCTGKGSVKVPTGSASGQGGAVWVRSNGGGAEFNMYGGTLDASGYTLTSNFGGAVCVDAGQSFNLYGGTIKGGNASATGGGSVQVNGTFNMYGGTIENGKAKYGGNISLNNANAVATVYGGLITGGHTTAQGGNVAVDTGKFTLEGGKITKGISDGNNGGNISVCAAAGSVTVNGGEVTDGKTTNMYGANIASFYNASGSLTITGGTINGGVMVAAGWMNLKNKPVITGGTTNVFLATGKKLAISDLVEGAKVGITMQTPGQIATSTTATNTKYLTSDNKAYTIAVDSTNGTYLKIPVTSIEVSEITVLEEDTVTAEYKIVPDNASNKNVTFTIADTSIATVDNTGKVTGVKKGETTLKVTAEDGGIYGEAKVTVTTNKVAVTSVSLDYEDEELFVDESLEITAEVLPLDATNKTVTWISSDTSVATVTDGVVKAKALGTATITASCEEGTVKAECKITVVAHKSHCICGGSLEDVELVGTTHTCEPLEWKDLNAELSKIMTEQSLAQNTAFEKLKSGNYYLSKDITVNSAQLNVPANTMLTICLNGHTITRSGSIGRVISLFYEGSKLNLTDCCENKGTIKVPTGSAAAQGGAVWARNYTGVEFNLYGGTLDASGYTTTSNGGAVENDGSAIFNMYGGVIKGAASAAKGGAVYAEKNFTMYGGTIDGGKATGEGGAVRIHAGTFTMNGGTIKNGYCTTKGGNLFINVNSHFIMNGGEMLDGQADTYGGNIAFNAVNNYTAGDMTLNDGVISGGKAQYAGNIMVLGAGNSLSVLTINGGTIKDGEATKVTTGGHSGNIDCGGKVYMKGGTIKDGKASSGGGNVCLLDATSYFEMTGGTITGGMAGTQDAGGVYAFYNAPTTNCVVLKGGLITGNNGGVYTTRQGSVALSGDIQIVDNYGANLKLNSSLKVTVGTFTNKAKVGVTLASPQVFAENVTSDVSATFFSDNTTYHLIYDTAMKTLGLQE